MRNILVKRVEKHPAIYDAINNVASLRPFLDYNLEDLEDDFRDVDENGDSKLNFEEFLEM